MASLTLFPQKEFILTLSDGSEVKGKFGTWALKQFGLKKGLPLLSQLSQLFLQEKKDNAGNLVKDENGKQEYDISIPDMIDYILCAIEHEARRDNARFTFTDVQLCDWADECNEPGILMKLYSHSVSSDEKKTEAESP